VTPVPPDPHVHETLTRLWSRPPGLWGWLSAVNHRAIGIRYVVTAFVFMLLAGVLALVMRLQLARPDLGVVGPAAFNQVFTLHGTTMMFLFAVPMLEGIGIYLVPLMIGTRDMAFPRLNAFGYWVYLFAGLALWGSFFAGSAPDAGWFNYPPFAGPAYSPGPNIDFYVTMITFIEVAALVAAVELIVTVFKQRAPGMSLGRMPIFVWAQLVMSFMIVFAMPPLMLVSVELMLDRVIGAHFFNPAAGGNPILWQHLFWIFGHPDVYIILIPALGIVSMIVPTAARVPLAGYVLVAMSIVAIGFLSFGLWVHHMYATGLALMGLNFFAAVGMVVTLPSAVQIFAWLATIWRGTLRITTAFLYVLGFLVLLVLGGITGVMLSSPAFDWQAHDSYFVVAHFHYILVGGAVLPIFAALYFWFPKMTGRLLSERLGRWNFWLTFIGVHVTFFPLHFVGLRGMVRRVYTYLPGLGFDTMNLVATIGAFLMGAGVLLLAVNIVWSLRRGEVAGPNPWGASTLEWAAASPPDQYNFAAIPTVRSRDPLWEQEHLGLVDGGPGSSYLTLDPESPRREVVVTTVLDAAPDHIAMLPGPTTWPLWAAIGAATAFLGSMVHLLLVPVGALIFLVSVIGWLWPKDDSPP
jgi:cytochrome c oxidase subunit I+III